MMPKVVFFSSTAYNDLLGKSSGQKKKKCVPVCKLMIMH